MTPYDSRTLALQIATNAISSHLYRVHGRTRFTFADTLSIETIQMTLMSLQPAEAVTGAEEQTDLDHGQSESIAPSQQAVAEALGLRVVDTGDERDTERAAA